MPSTTPQILPRAKKPTDTARDHLRSYKPRANFRALPGAIAACISKKVSA